MKTALTILLVAVIATTIQADTCNNGIKDANEADVDCGNSCFALCQNGMKCLNDFDCDSFKCDKTVCVEEEKIERFLGASGSSAKAPSPAALSPASNLSMSTITFVCMFIFAALVL